MSIDFEKYLIEAAVEKIKYHITLPKIINPSNISTFLIKIKDVFGSEYRNRENFVVDLRKVSSLNVLGILLIYKVIEYSVEKECFYRPVIFINNEYLENKINEYEFSELINAYIRGGVGSQEAMSDLKVKITDRFIMAPQPLIRESNFTNHYLKNFALPKIQEYYRNDNPKISLISLCLSEILLNFWEHAIEDTKSVLISDGKENSIEIACADTGNGILSTLKKNNNLRDFSDIDIFSSCVKMGITSKLGTNHMGYGLWLIDQIVKGIKGRFHIYSEGYEYKNEWGTSKINKISYWKGTIVYLYLPLDKAFSLEDVIALKKYSSTNFNNKVKVNYT